MNNSINEKAKALGITPMENSEINIMYTNAFAIYFLCQDAEKRMARRKSHFRFESKKHFTAIMEALKRAKHEQDQLYQDYVTAWGSNVKNYDYEQKDANDLARLLMLWYDRVEGYHNRVNELEKFIRETWPAEEVSDDDLQVFKMAKLK